MNICVEEYVKDAKVLNTDSVCCVLRIVFLKASFYIMPSLFTVFTHYPVLAVTETYSVKWILEYNTRNLLMKARGCIVIFFYRAAHSIYILLQIFCENNAEYFFSFKKMFTKNHLHSHPDTTQPPPSPIYCHPRWMSLEICGQKFPIIQYIDLTPPSLYRQKLR